MNYEIITSAELAKHRKAGKLGIAALVLASLLALGSAFGLGWASGKADAYETAMARIEDLERENARAAETFVVAWQNQQDAIKFIANFAQYIQGRQDQQQMNQALAPYPRPVRARKWQHQ